MIFESLNRWTDPTVPIPEGFPHVERWQVGTRGPIDFVVTHDHLGQIELSLKLAKSRGKPTDAHVLAFFRALGVAPVDEDETARSHRHFLMKLPSTVH